MGGDEKGERKRERERIGSPESEWERETGIGGVSGEHWCIYSFIYKILKKKVNEFLKEPWIFPVYLNFGKQYFPWKKVLLICKASAKDNVWNDKKTKTFIWPDLKAIIYVKYFKSTSGLN